MLGHRLGEFGVWPETRETGEIDAFLSGRTEEWGPELLAPPARDWETGIIIPILQSSTESVRGTKSPKTITVQIT